MVCPYTKMPLIVSSYACGYAVSVILSHTHLLALHGTVKELVTPNEHWLTGFTVLAGTFSRPTKEGSLDKDIPAFPARHSAKENLSREQHVSSLRRYLNHLEIHIKKLTHAWRIAGSRTVDAAGVDDKV